jgi:hypothetical protein
MGHRAGGNNSTWEIACLLSLKYYFLLKKKENNKLFIIHQYSNLFRMSHNVFFFVSVEKIQSGFFCMCKQWLFLQQNYESISSFTSFNLLILSTELFFISTKHFTKSLKKIKFLNSYSLSTNPPFVPLALISFHLSEKCLVVWNAFWYFWCVNWK